MEKGKKKELPHLSSMFIDSSKLMITEFNEEEYLTIVLGSNYGHLLVNYVLTSTNTNTNHPSDNTNHPSDNNNLSSDKILPQDYCWRLHSNFIYELKQQ